MKSAAPSNWQQYKRKKKKITLEFEVVGGVGRGVGGRVIGGRGVGAGVAGTGFGVGFGVGLGGN